ncbi:far upstream element-binding protein 2-like protein, partial [Tanacetum coccineum]
MDADPNSQTRGVELTGSSKSIAKAEKMIIDVLAKAEAGGSGVVGLIIGKGGETIKSMQASTGARIQ